MIFTALFGFFAAIALSIPLWAWIVGLLCIASDEDGNLLLFCLFMCVAMDASISFYVMGFICILFDAILMAASEN